MKKTLMLCVSIFVVSLLYYCLGATMIFAEETRMAPDKKGLPEVGLAPKEAQMRQMNIQQKIDFQNTLNRFGAAIEQLKLRERFPKIGFSVGEAEVRQATLIAGMNNIKSGKKVFGADSPGRSVLDSGNISVMEFYDENGTPLLERRQKLSPAPEEAPEEWFRLGEQKATLLVRTVTAKELKEASAILGSQVAAGQVILPDRNLSHVYVISKFYDREDRYIGQHAVSASPAATSPDAWYRLDEKGDLAFLR